ncbi:hypothetical protein VH567_02765 [Sphingomonas sp. 4RDLI-65]|uniref:hypothetical protein n=1 Tax=Sphingomonas sp. 4RDLI-65 TaxID=3111641 RepID=UPI003C256030
MVASAPLGAEQVDLMNARLLPMPDNGTLIAPASPTGLTISSMAGHMMRQLPEDQEHALAFAPADDLLDLPFLKDVPNLLAWVRPGEYCRQQRETRLYGDWLLVLASGRPWSS